MIKVKLLHDVVGDLRSLADSIQAVAEAIPADVPVNVEKEEIAAPAKESKASAKPVTLEQVRAVLADKSQLGFTAQVRTLLEKYGAPKLSQIDPANYAALLADSESLQ